MRPCQRGAHECISATGAIVDEGMLFLSVRPAGDGADRERGATGAP